MIGGAANALFFLFHLWLGWYFHRLPGLPPFVRSVIEMLNGATALFMLFLAIASLAYATEVLATRLGLLMLVTACALFGLRALAEIFVAPTFSTPIFVTCLVTSALYFAALPAFREAASVSAPVGRLKGT